jgi:hypothetical protein
MSRMTDKGIQTGVLERVQHIFESKQQREQPPTSYLEVRRSTLKRVKSVEALLKLRKKSTSTVSLRPGEEGSGSSTSTHSLHEGDEEDEPSTSTATASVYVEKDPQLTARHGRYWERQQTVGDLRSRLEKAKAEQAKQKEKEEKRPSED